MSPWVNSRERSFLSSCLGFVFMAIAVAYTLAWVAFVLTGGGSNP